MAGPHKAQGALRSGVSAISGNATNHRGVNKKTNGFGVYGKYPVFTVYSASIFKKLIHSRKVSSTYKHNKSQFVSIAILGY